MATQERWSRQTEMDVRRVPGMLQAILGTGVVVGTAEHLTQQLGEFAVGIPLGIRNSRWMFGIFMLKTLIKWLEQTRKREEPSYFASVFHVT